MAKLSANGCHKIAEATKLVPSTVTDGTLRLTLALRSDGAVLSKMRHADGTSTGYTAKGYLRAKEGVSSVERFTKYAEQRGFTVQ